MLLKKLESFFLLLTFGFFLFSCTVEEKKVQEKPFVSTECEVSIDLLGVDSFEQSTYEFDGTLDDSPIYIPGGTGSHYDIVLGTTGILEITVRANSLSSKTMVARGTAVKNITASTNFEIKLTPVNPSDDVYLTLVNESETVRLAYAKGEEVEDIAMPKKDGHTFVGWFTERNGQGSKFVLPYEMVEDVTLYPYWEVLDPSTTYTVTFETNGGSAVSPSTVKVGETIAQPTEPTKADYAFSGWYLDELFTQPVSFPYTVNSNVTLYAKWVSAGSLVKVTGVNLKETNVSLELGKAKQIIHYITPANATNTNVSWMSDNASVVSVNNGLVTGLAAGTATITVTTADGGFTATCTVTVSDTPINKTLSAVILTESAASTEEIPAFTATAKYTDRTTEEVTSKATWVSTDTSVATISAGGSMELKAAGKTEVTASYKVDNVTKESNKATVTVSAPVSGLIVYMLSTYGEVQGGGNFYGWKGDNQPYGAWPGSKMEKTSDGAACYFIVDDASKIEKLIVNGSGGQTPDMALPGDSGHWLLWHNGSAWAWKEYDGVKVGGGSSSSGTLTAKVDIEKPLIPEVPTVTISPAANGDISLKAYITVSYEENNASVNAANVTISGAVSKTYSLADFKNKSLSISVESLGLTADKTITVSASATNSEGTTSAGPVTLKTIDAPAPSKDTFTWDNVNAYFVLTDRFANGNSANDHSYSRKNGLSGDENVATFHGGDIKGLTDNMDYFKKLGINAIWITAPYEQAHGWVGGKNGKFPHYAFHGYYTLDWTFMDQNMGTIDEFRAFVQACHENGIRVIMDVVMNHVGYNNTQDMITYGHGKTSHGDGWLEKVGGKWEANDTVVWDHNLWETWWGPWARSFAYEKTGSEYGGSCGGLPDVRSEVADTNIGVAPVLKIKWEKEDNTAYDKWRVPAVANVDWWNKSGNWRQNQTARIVEYQCVWLSAWVREFGIDGFRCDTAKHVEPQYWGMLKDACTDALKKWRADSSKVDNSGAKNWDEAFWMTGECWGWTSTGGGGEYYQTGKFDSMINFSFNGGNSWDGNYRQGYPKPNNWDSYININKNGDSDGNGHRDNVLSYISSHDTALTRVGDQYEVGTGLVLLPGGVQIYYGDESYREKAYLGCGDGDMFTRGDMNLSEAKSSALTAHWGKVGNFRKYNPAVGAGTGSGTKRTYNDSKVAIGISGSSVDVSGLFTDGETVYNWYDGKSAVVSGGKVTFDGGSMKQPILVSDRNPADYEVTF